MQNTVVKEQVMMPVAEHLFDETIRHAGLTEFGYSLADMVQRIASVPAAGARFDIAFEGELNGPRIKGTITGKDYLLVRADGRNILNLQATIVTNDGASIALQEDGIMFQEPDEEGWFGLRLNMHFQTADPRYEWLNGHLVWGIGRAHMQLGIVNVQAYTA